MCCEPVLREHPALAPSAAASERRANLDPVPASVGLARSLVRESLAGFDNDARDVALLLTSELVTNAVMHASTEVKVTVAVADGVAEVGVTDSSSAVPTMRRSTWRAEGGRGLRLVDLLTQEWGVTPLPGGKQVWFRLDIGADWPHRTGCPCGGEDLDRVRLESGRYALAVPGPWDETDGSTDGSTG